MTQQPLNNSNGATGNGNLAGLPATTGRYLVLLSDSAMGDDGAQAIAESTGLTVTSASKVDGDVGIAETLASGGAVIFDRLGIAVVSTPPTQLPAVADDASPRILAVEPERYVHAFADQVVDAPKQATQFPVGYMLGYRDGINELVERILPIVDGRFETALQITSDETLLTWGLQATNVPQSNRSGKNVRVAILDTGIDMGHPDFVGRAIVTESFVQGEDVRDGHGHGTHCAGTACGPQNPTQGPRYGIAYDADLHVGKVLNNKGRGTDAQILAGIEWAINNQCAIVSMSLGSPVQLGDTFSVVFETAAQRALAAGTLIIAAAGNDSQRPVVVNPVGHPANCPSILAVAALTERLDVAFFSNAGLISTGGEVNIAAPGVNVLSSTRRPTTYARLSGTSMATPHIAGIAALLAEADPSARGQALADLLSAGARRLAALTVRDVGAGLVQAP